LLQCCSQSDGLKAILAVQSRSTNHELWHFRSPWRSFINDMPGYSGTPLAQKLGIKPGTAVKLIGAPQHYRELLGPAAELLKFSNRIADNCMFVHLFVTDRPKLEAALAQLRWKLADAGTVWVSWPKKSSGVRTDVTEDVIRAVALPLGFVDVKVCAVDDVWSGLKLMIRREHRKRPAKPT
jgi:hypothetical protein